MLELFFVGGGLFLVAEWVATAVLLGAVAVAMLGVGVVVLLSLTARSMWRNPLENLRLWCCFLLGSSIVFAIPLAGFELLVFQGRPWQSVNSGQLTGAQGATAIVCGLLLWIGAPMATWSLYEWLLEAPRRALVGRIRAEGSK